MGKDTTGENLDGRAAASINKTIRPNDVLAKHAQVSMPNDGISLL